MNQRLEALLKMEQQSPQDPFLGYAIAIELKNTGKEQEAFERLENLLSAKQDYLPTYQLYGQWLSESGQTEKAIHILQTGYKLAVKMNELKTAREIRQLLLDLED